MQLNWQAPDEWHTERLGQALANCLLPGSVVALVGTLGAGKTRLVKALASAAGVPADEVCSPTFTLVHEYQGRVPIYHFDAYRLADDDEFLQLGPEEYFESLGWTLIEWADRVSACLPTDYLQISIEVISPTARLFQLHSVGPVSQTVLECLTLRLPGIVQD